MSDGTKKRDKLIDLMTRTEVESGGVVSKYQSYVKEAQFTVDFASAYKDVVIRFPDDSVLSPQEWDDQISAWSETLKRAQYANNSTEGLQFVSSALTSSNSTAGAVSYRVISRLPSANQYDAARSYERVQGVLSARNFIADIEKECTRLGIKPSKPGAESVLALLRHGKQAYDVPSSGRISAAAVLIPIRSAIDAACAELLQRRPQQEKTGGLPQKVRLICEQCHLPHIKPTDIGILERRANSLHDELSRAKEAAMRREEVRELMNNAFLFFLDFLQMIDENKLKPAAHP